MHSSYRSKGGGPTGLALLEVVTSCLGLFPCKSSTSIVAREVLAPVREEELDHEPVSMVDGLLRRCGGDECFPSRTVEFAVVEIPN